MTSSTLLLRHSVLDALIRSLELSASRLAHHMISCTSMDEDDECTDCDRLQQELYESRLKILEYVETHYSHTSL